MRVRLEPLGPAVVEEYWAAVQDEEVGRLTGTHATFTRDQIERWLASRGQHDDRVDWAAIRIADGAYLGEAVINDVDRDNGSAGFRIALAGPHVFGQGYGTEIVRMAVAHAFDRMGLHRLELQVFAFNPRAIRVYEKCGFHHEGRLREALSMDGERHDTLVMGILSTDPRP